MRALMAGVSVAVLLCASFPACARTWHVPDEVPTIQAGMDSAAVGDTVLVACGTYYEHDITMKSGITLRSETGDPECVTIDAEELGRGFYCHTVDSTAIIEGITVAHGAGSTGGGIYCYNSSPRLVNCAFEHNMEIQSGGVIFCVGGSAPAVISCTFADNHAYWYGGIVYCSGSSPAFTDCTFVRTGAHVGGIMYCDDSSAPVLTNCYSYAANARWGSGVYCVNSSPELTDCTFSSMSGWSLAGGGLYCSGSSPTLRNCTIYAHYAQIGAGLYCVGGSAATLENSIIAFGSEGEAVYCDGSSSATLYCCDIYGNAGGDWVGCIAGQYGIDGNISEDPLFCDPENDDLRLQYGSPCAPANNPECGLIGAWPVCALEAVVDFDPNTLNCRSQGSYVTCYIELPDGCDPTDIDVSAVILNDVLAALSSPTAVGDYDGDGVPDRMVKFGRRSVIALLPEGEEVEVTVSGELTDGTPFAGTDMIRVICKMHPSDATELPDPNLRVSSAPGVSSSTTVSYEVEAAGPVSLRVYDVSGRLVRTLVDGPQGKGHHDIPWGGKSDEGRRVGAGVYFVRLEVGTKTATGKLVLIK